MDTCDYSKTVAGSCPQPARPGKDKCYYHLKVEAGLINAAEDEIMRDMPTFKER